MNDNKEMNEDTEEVLDFLKEIQDSEKDNTVRQEPKTSVELDEKEMEELYGAANDAAEKEILEEIPEIPVRDEFKATPYKDLFSMLVTDIGDVTVSDYEKDMFIKSVLNDTQFYTTSKILGGKLSIEVKSRTMYTDKLVFDSLNYDEQNKKILGLDSMLYRLQMYVAACQLKGYNHKDLELHLDPIKTFEENYKILNDHVDKVLSRIPAHVWSAIVMGIRIHEYKSKLCMDNLNNENFWESAGTN